MGRPYTDPTTGEWVGEYETRVVDQITRQTEWFDTESEARRFARTGKREIHSSARRSSPENREGTTPMARLAPDSLELPTTTDYTLPVQQWPETIQLDQLSATSDALDLDAGQIVGGILRWQRGDGFAIYLVTSDKPLTLQHVNFMDGWTVEPALIRGLTRDDVLDMLRRAQRVRKLFRGGRA